MPDVTNISAYRFTPLADLKTLRAELIERCREWALKGTILVSTEGINLFVAGPRPEIDSLLELLRAVPGLEDLSPKVSVSRDQPFSRMLVKIKREIISFGVAGIDPARAPSPRLSPRELKAWLDEGRPVTLLDARNDYEVKLGTFKNALALGIDHFREFPAAVQALPESLKSKPVVTFCTGGIRCEKAGPLLQREGFEQVYQLDGGILKYFEECGGGHFHGECFVFDKRVGLDPALEESAAGVCFQCQAVLDERDRSDPRFVEGRFCPHCFVNEAEQQSRDLAEHRRKLAAAIDPLPGSLPRDNFRPLRVAARHDGLPLIVFLSQVVDQPRSRWLAEFAAGSIVGAEKKPAAPDSIVRAGERYFHRECLAVEPAVNAAIEILHEDAALIVVNKPAPLPMHPSGRFNRNTLQELLRTAYAPEKPRPAHRLDAATTGVALFTRSVRFARFVQPQFERGEVEKAYLARVIGHPPVDEFECDASIGIEPGPLGTRALDAHGLRAFTQFRVTARLADGTSLLEVKPRTGRTHQIRLHLAHLGWPILGDPLYAGQDPPLALHAWRLTLRHPIRNERVTYEAPPPMWFSMGEPGASATGAVREGEFTVPVAHARHVP